MARGITETGGGNVELIIYDASNDLTWGQVGTTGDGTVTDQLTYPFYIDISVGAANADTSATYQTTETFDFSKVNGILIDYSSLSDEPREEFVGTAILTIDSIEFGGSDFWALPTGSDRRIEYFDLSSVTGTSNFIFYYLNNVTAQTQRIDIRLTIHKITLIYGIS